MSVQANALEGALWAAVRALEEKAELGRRLAERAQARGMNKSAARFERASHDAEAGSSMIRDTLLNGPVRKALESPAEETDLATSRDAGPRVNTPKGR